MLTLYTSDVVSLFLAHVPGYVHIVSQLPHTFQDADVLSKTYLSLMHAHRPGLEAIALQGKAWELVHVQCVPSDFHLLTYEHVSIHTYVYTCHGLQVWFPWRGVVSILVPHTDLRGHLPAGNVRL